MLKCHGVIYCHEIIEETPSDPVSFLEFRIGILVCTGESTLQFGSVVPSENLLGMLKEEPEGFIS